VTYIKHEDRAEFDLIIRGLQHLLREVPRDKRKGALNYVLSRLALGAFGEYSEDRQRLIVPIKYHDVSDCVSALRDAADEINRRLMHACESLAIDKNGDLEEYP
jgi:hypothetical protein